MAHSLRDSSKAGFRGVFRSSEEASLDKEVINPVMTKLNERIFESVHVSVNYAKIADLGNRMKKEELPLPKWDAPVFLTSSPEKTASFLMLGNCINFAFTDFSTGKIYNFSHGGIPWNGAFAMWCALKTALEEGKPMLEGDYLARMTLADAKEIFEKDSTIPMLQERVKILNQVGGVLVEKYDSHFHNLLAEADGRIFDEGNEKGLVSLLIDNFPSFYDTWVYHGRKVPINKRAQLVPIMLHGKLLGMDASPFRKSHLDALTVAADYELPKVLHASGVLEYDKELEMKVKKGVLIPAGSEEEVELRLNTIWASNQLQNVVNAYMPPEKCVNALNIDYRLWNEGRQYAGEKHHRTVTTAY